MKISPLDIEQKCFPKANNGYDEKEVDLFLVIIRDEIEANLRDNAALKDEIAHLNEINSHLREANEADSVVWKFISNYAGMKNNKQNPEIK